MNKDQQFFFDHAGSSYRPDHESEFVGRVLGAINLATAEAWAHDVGALFKWDTDETDSSEFSAERPSWSLYHCALYLPCDECPRQNIGLWTNDAMERCARKMWAHVKASLGGIDFGRDGEPWSDPYKRVVEAELALEAMPD